LFDAIFWFKLVLGIEHFTEFVEPILAFGLLIYKFLSQLLAALIFFQICICLIFFDQYVNLFYSDISVARSTLPKGFFSCTLLYHDTRLRIYNIVTAKALCVSDYIIYMEGLLAGKLQIVKLLYPPLSFQF
jgi:hypothetical protein